MMEAGGDREGRQMYGFQRGQGNNKVCKQIHILQGRRGRTAVMMENKNERVTDCLATYVGEKEQRNK